LGEKKKRIRQKKIFFRCRRRSSSLIFILFRCSFYSPELLHVAAQRAAPGSCGHGAAIEREKERERERERRNKNKEQTRFAPPFCFFRVDRRFSREW